MKLKLSLGVLILQGLVFSLLVAQLTALSPRQIRADIAEIRVQTPAGVRVISGHALTCGQPSAQAVCWVEAKEALLKVVVQYEGASRKAIQGCQAFYGEQRVRCTASLVYVGTSVLPSVTLTERLDLEVSEPAPAATLGALFPPDRLIFFINLMLLSLVANLSLILWWRFIHNLSAYPLINQSVLAIMAVLLLCFTKFNVEFGLMYLGFSD